MIELVFTLCALTCLACAVLLLRGYLRSRFRLLLWSSLCFTALALSNALRLAQQLRGSPEEMAWVANLPALVGVALLLWGLIHDVE